jgi:hypothetical protein
MAFKFINDRILFSGLTEVNGGGGNVFIPITFLKLVSNLNPNTSQILFLSRRSIISVCIFLFLPVHSIAGTNQYVLLKGVLSNIQACFSLLKNKVVYCCAVT